jgi:hypothetical protein
MKKIKPCPFCGIAPKPRLRYGRWELRCENENCPGKGSSPLKDAAIENWNMRYKPKRG